MKLKYLGNPKRDGSYPSVQIGKEFVKVVDGFVEVNDVDAVKLIATKNFAVEGASAELAAPPATPPANPDELTPSGNPYFKPTDPAFPDSDDKTTIAEVDADIKAKNAEINPATTELDPEPTPAAETVESKASEAAAAGNPVSTEPVQPAPAAEPVKAAEPAAAADDKAALLTRAKALGIPANASWGVPSLKKAIAKAEAK